MLDPTYLILVIVSLLFGSFTNLLVYRIPQRLNIAFPPSHCPSCEHQLSWWENIPIISFIILKAKCSYCRVAIPWDYPLVELAVLLISLPFLDFDS
jgi:leader peptidase (prepilin peptidase)/N-methyltransferase